MNISDVRALSADQINDEVLKLKKEQFNLRFQRATGQLEKATRFREIRRTIARLLTVANERTQGRDVTSKASKTAKAPKAAKPKAEKTEAKADKPKAEKPAAKAKTETKPAAKKAAKTKAED